MDGVLPNVEHVRFPTGSDENKENLSSTFMNGFNPKRKKSHKMTEFTVSEK